MRPKRQVQIDDFRFSQKLTLVVVLALYLPACALPAVYYDDGVGPGTLGSVPELAGLLLGWLEACGIPWSANILLLIGLLQLRRRRFKLAVCLGGLATAMAATTLAIVPKVLVGFFLWQGALMAFTVGASFLVVTSLKKSAEEISLSQVGPTVPDADDN